MSGGAEGFRKEQRVAGCDWSFVWRGSLGGGVEGACAYGEVEVYSRGSKAEYLWWTLTGNICKPVSVELLGMDPTLPTPWGIIQQKDIHVCPETLLNSLYHHRAWIPIRTCKIAPVHSLDACHNPANKKMNCQVGATNLWRDRVWLHAQKKQDSRANSLVIPLGRELAYWRPSIYFKNAYGYENINIFLFVLTCSLIGRIIPVASIRISTFALGMQREGCSVLVGGVGGWRSRLLIKKKFKKNNKINKSHT